MLPTFAQQLPSDDGGGQLEYDQPAEARRCQLDMAFRSEQRHLFRYVQSRIGPDAAPDIVQEVFVRAAGSRQLGVLDNPGGFLRRIARNLLIDRARAWRLRPDHVPLDEAIEAAVAPTQELDLQAEDTLRQFEMAIAGLSPKTRRVFLMHRVEELSYREIHLKLGISIGTVEYHMTRALAHITANLDRSE